MIIVNPIDRHVGSRVRLRRMLIGLSQEDLGNALGVTFQQVQRYEKGTNRIGASRLHQIAKTLNVPVSYFFTGMAAVGNPDNVLTRHCGDDHLAKFLSSQDGLSLIKHFMRIQNARLRKRIIALVEQIAEEDS